MHRWLVALAVVSALGLGACLFPSLDGLAGDGGVATDAPASSDAEAGDAALRSYKEEVAADSPASWWRLGEVDARAPAYDEMGAAPGAYQTPGVTVGVPGAIAGDENTATTFDGKNGAMYVSGSLYDFGGTSSFSIEVWVAPAHGVDAASAVQRIVSHRTLSPANGWRLYLDGSLRAVFDRWNNDVAVAMVATAKPLPLGAFTHLVVTCDGATLILYENGVVQAQVPAASTPNASASTLSWATASLLNGEFFAGALDEATIYAHPLAPERVLAHYRAGSGK